jgi:hypothetical protein
MTDTPTDVKQPADHKAKAEPYVWTSGDGVTVTLKPFKKLPAGVLEDIDGMSEIKSTFALLKAATSEADYQTIRGIALDELEDLQAEWMKASGVELPES